MFQTKLQKTADMDDFVNFLLMNSKTNLKTYIQEILKGMEGSNDFGSHETFDRSDVEERFVESAYEDKSISEETDFDIVEIMAQKIAEDAMMELDSLCPDFFDTLWELY